MGLLAAAVAVAAITSVRPAFNAEMVARYRPDITVLGGCSVAADDPNHTHALFAWAASRSYATSVADTWLFWSFYSPNRSRCPETKEVAEYLVRMEHEDRTLPPLWHADQFPPVGPNDDKFMEEIQFSLAREGAVRPPAERERFFEAAAHAKAAAYAVGQLRAAQNPTTWRNDHDRRVYLGLYLAAVGRETYDARAVPNALPAWAWRELDPNPRQP